MPNEAGGTGPAGDRTMSEQHFTFRFRYFWLGNALAIGMSFATWHSILWAIWHGVWGWTYVAYWAVGRYAR